MTKPPPSPKTPALGRGLEALMPAGVVPGASVKGVMMIPLDEIEPMPGQPRVRFRETELKELADSIREKGVLQPILVSSAGPHRYRLIAGERRLRAARLAGLSTIPATVKEVDEREAFELALIENLQREDLNAVEVARAFKKLIDEYGLVQEQVASRVGKDRTSVSNYLRLLKLPRLLLERLEDGTLSFGHGRALCALPPEGVAQLDLSRLASGRLSVRELERLVARWQAERKAGAPGGGAKAKPEPSPQIRYLRKQLEQATGLKVSVEDRGGSGTLQFTYHSLDELDRLLTLMGIKD